MAAGADKGGCRVHADHCGLHRREDLPSAVVQAVFGKQSEHTELLTATARDTELDRESEKDKRTNLETHTE